MHCPMSKSVAASAGELDLNLLYKFIDSLTTDSGQVWHNVMHAHLINYSHASLNLHTNC